MGNPWLKAAITTGSLSLAGDLLAQAFIRRHQSVRSLLPNKSHQSYLGSQHLKKLLAAQESATDLHAMHMTRC